jgi:phospholipase D1/2
MSTAAPSDGRSNLDHMEDKIEEKIKHPFSDLREKFRDSKLYDLKVGLINKK